jgi:hypothetical protein
MPTRTPQKIKLNPENQERYARLKIAWANLNRDAYAMLNTKKEKEVNETRSKISIVSKEKDVTEKEIAKVQTSIRTKNALLKASPKRRPMKEKPIMTEQRNPHEEYDGSIEPISWADLQKAGVSDEQINAMKQQGIDPSKSTFGGISHEEGEI